MVETHPVDSLLSIPFLLVGGAGSDLESLYEAWDENETNGLEGNSMYQRAFEVVESRSYCLHYLADASAGVGKLAEC